MEESKELQGFYKIFRAVVYISVLMEFFEYAIDPAVLDHWGGILIDIHGRIKRWMIYNDGNLVYCSSASPVSAPEPRSIWSSMPSGRCCIRS